MDDVEVVIARNPDADSTLPYLLRLPLGPEGIVLKVRDTWPRTAKVYCHRAGAWPDDVEVIEMVSARSCVRRGASIDLVLDRARENRSQFVFATARGREVIFWQSARTAKQARPSVKLPTKRASGQRLEILVDSHERYAWTFSHQQATTVRKPLFAGDYGVEVDGKLIASVERKSLDDLRTTLTSGKLRYVLADLATLPHGALVVEDRYSALFKLTHVRPSTMADGLAEAQVRFPTIPIVFCETRPLAQEWTYRFLGAALAHHDGTVHGGRIERELRNPSPAQLAVGERHAPDATPAEIRKWAIAAGFDVSTRGRIRPEIVTAYRLWQTRPTH